MGFSYDKNDTQRRAEKEAKGERGEKTDNSKFRDEDKTCREQTAGVSQTQTKTAQELVAVLVGRHFHS